ncbi:MAG: hypothetical protein U0K36_10380 [Bacteroidales bacterium]|nr:hypothetical protein [Bacteroidales bacterium]
MLRSSVRMCGSSESRERIGGKLSYVNEPSDSSRPPEANGAVALTNI